MPPSTQQQGEMVIETAEILQAESYPVQVRLELTGTLPSTCHQLVYSVTLPDSHGRIFVEAAAELGETANCATTDQPFRQGIGVGSYTEGSYEVILNGEAVGRFELGGGELPGALPTDESGLVQGPVYIDETELAILESFPVQVELVIRGTLPTPCATLEWTAELPDQQGRIFVEAHSLQNPDLACIQVLQQIEERLPIGSYTEGEYSVWLNGELVGEFDV